MRALHIVAEPTYCDGRDPFGASCVGTIPPPVCRYGILSSLLFILLSLTFVKRDDDGRSRNLCQTAFWRIRVLGLDACKDESP